MTVSCGFCFPKCLFSKEQGKEKTLNAEAQSRGGGAVFSLVFGWTSASLRLCVNNACVFSKGFSLLCALGYPFVPLR
jgi:hypothetical protein